VAMWKCRLSRERELAGRRAEARRLLLEAVEVLLEETPGDQHLVDGLIRSVARIADQTPTEASLDVARLRTEVDELRAEVSRRDGQLAGVSGELARLKASRFWRARQFLVSVPGLQMLLVALGRFAASRQPVK